MTRDDEQVCVPFPDNHVEGPDELSERQNLVTELRIHQEELEAQNEELRSTQKALEDTKNRYFHLFDLSPAIYILFDKRLRVLEINLRAAELLNVGRNMTGCLPFLSFIGNRKDRDLFANHVAEVFASGKRQFVEVELMTSGSTTRTVRFESDMLQRGDVEHPTCLSAGMDVTELRDAQAAVRASLDQKELLLKEIHHRVKNNLQVVSSLLNLQSKQTDDEKVVDILQQSRNRIYAMALVHEKLYEADDLQLADFKDYAGRLLSYVMRSYAQEARGIRLEVSIERVRLDIDQSISLGLILHELVSNSIKHAFTSGFGGKINVALVAVGDDGYLLKVKDDGVGLPDRFDLTRSQRLGHSLIRIITEKLNGRIEVKDHCGLEIRIWFPADSLKEGRAKS